MRLAVAVLVTLIVCEALAQNPKKATADDLNAMVSTWNTLMKPGTILQTTHGGVPFILFEDGVEAVCTSKVGDLKNSPSELVRQNRAITEGSVVRVMVLGYTRCVCFRLRTLGVACSTVPETLASVFRDLSFPKPMPTFTKEQDATRLANLNRLFVNRDLSNYIEDDYASVQILRGKNSGVKGYVKVQYLTQAAGPLVVSENAIRGEDRTTFDFRQTRWGMSRAQVISAEGKPLSSSPDGLLYQNEVAGLKAGTAFQFVDDKLAKATYFLMEKYVEPNQYITNGAKWLKVLKDKYGEPTPDIQWFNDLYRRDEQKYAFAVSAGHLIIRNSWNINRTKIENVISGKNFEISVRVTYVSRELEAALDNKAKEAEKKAF